MKEEFRLLKQKMLKIEKDIFSIYNYYGKILNQIFRHQFIDNKTKIHHQHLNNHDNNQTHFLHTTNN
jgi:hypothetical protein